MASTAKWVFFTVFSKYPLLQVVGLLLALFGVIGLYSTAKQVKENLF